MATPPTGSGPPTPARVTVLTPEDESTPTEGGGVETGTCFWKFPETIEDVGEDTRKVAATDTLGGDATGAGDLPVFADSTEDAEAVTKPRRSHDRPVPLSPAGRR
jgi:hypothetical protein